MKKPIACLLCVSLFWTARAVRADTTVTQARPSDRHFNPSVYEVKKPDSLLQAAQKEILSIQKAANSNSMSFYTGADNYRAVHIAAQDAQKGSNDTSTVQNKVKPWIDWLQHRLQDNYLLSFDVPAAKDPALEKVDPNAQDYLTELANTYDQGASALVFLKNGQKDIAAKILDRIQEKPYLPGKSNLENLDVLSGEAIWIGIAAAQYNQITQTNRYDRLLKRVDEYLKENQISDGSIRGGPDKPWASTEHNLDALAYLIMRHTMDPKGGFDVIASKVANWLVTSAYDTKEKRFNRGQNDPIFATDTSSWGVLALSAVKEMAPDFFTANKLDGIDLSKLMETVESKAFVKDQEISVEGKSIKISGYTYGSPLTPLSFEWSFGVAAAYRALGNSAKADRIIAELDKAQIKDAQGGMAYPYASRAGKTFLGGGWTASTFPSASSTIWRILYELKVNPFSFGPSPR